ncbi:hypothetical protein B0J11DRAFT_446088 [Dendryphion nanum]|uniref:LITAF domain-containing protein n=1 Tax=Dendryphion nanum TaxID=256645 RepID=A0A9P9D5V8_9PLEO|nr:hypothetical protein B0J11DRAFT_446088 [Dendryphion nanum]
MGLPTSPQDAAPAYNDVFHNHPVNQFPPSGSSSSYRAVPQDDVELLAHECSGNQTSPSPAPGQQNETLAQTIAGVFRPQPHTHCEQCDIQTTAREIRDNERHCCTMTAYTFIIAFFCLMIVGIVAFNAALKSQRHHD